jgi:hypothetical protein
MPQRSLLFHKANPSFLEQKQTNHVDSACSIKRQYSAQLRFLSKATSCGKQKGIILPEPACSMNLISLREKGSPCSPYFVTAISLIYFFIS